MIDRSFIEKIVELSRTEQINIDGVEYTTKKLYEVSKPKAEKLSVNSLESVCAFVKNTLEQKKINYPLMIEVSHDEVNVRSQLSDNLERDFLLQATPLLPRLNLGSWQDVEQFIINLQTCYEETDVRTHVLDLVSNFMRQDTLEIKDNGISQIVTVQEGVSLKDSVAIQPIVKLKPYRTFGEVDQVETMFLFRADKNTRVSLHEADGGQWKNVARQRIVEYLDSQLSSLIADNQVVIIG